MSFSWILDGDIGGLGRPEHDDLHALRALGVGLLVSLTEQPIPVPLLEEAGLRGLHLPIADFHAPRPDQVETFIHAAFEVRAAGEAVAVHCAAGLGRTGTMLACYLVARGWPASAAIERVRSCRPGSIETGPQEQTVYMFAARRSK